MGKGEKDAGNKVGEGLTKFVSGVGQGVDKELMVEVELSKEVTDLGISKTVSKQETLKDGKGFSVYFIASKAVESTLTAKAYNADDLEIGRTTTNIKLNIDDAKYVEIKFDDKVDLQLVKKYKIDVKK